MTGNIDGSREGYDTRAISQLSSTKLRIVLSAVLVASGCASQAPAPRAPEPSFIRASRIIEHGPPAIDAALNGEELAPPPAELEPESAQESSEAFAPPSPTPLDPGETREALPPDAVVARANDLASRAPDEGGFVNSRVSYTFVEGDFFKVYACPFYATDIVLEPGEELLGPVAGGDPTRWRLDVTTGAVGGIAQKHIILKPQRPGLKTNLIVTTDRRVYYINLESLESTFMVSVRWTYPQDEQAPLPLVSTTAPASSASASTPVPLENLNFDYAIEGVSGKPSWKPRAVYDDGAHTYVRFDRRLLTGEAPALYVVERGEAQLVNYRVKDTLYVVDRLFEVAELRLGNEDQDVVRLRNRRAGSKSARPQPQTGRTPRAARPGTPR